MGKSIGTDKNDQDPNMKNLEFTFSYEAGVTLHTPTSVYTIVNVSKHSKVGMTLTGIPRDPKKGPFIPNNMGERSYNDSPKLKVCMNGNEKDAKDFKGALMDLIREFY